MSITDNLRDIKKDLPKEVDLVAVSKFHSQEEINKLYSAGQRIFGESRMQELKTKHQALPSDIEWHFIGHLQRNKVKDIVSYVNTIQSVDSERLLQEINKQSNTEKRAICCLLQLHIAEEENKYGFSFDECRQLLEKKEWKSYEYAYIGGVMGMATLTDNLNQVRKEFKELKLFFDEIKKTYFLNDEKFKNISMGMSGDYQIAIEEGSTMIRIGTSLFGEREY